MKIYCIAEMIGPARVERLRKVFASDDLKISSVLNTLRPHLYAIGRGLDQDMTTWGRGDYCYAEIEGDKSEVTLMKLRNDGQIAAALHFFQLNWAADRTVIPLCKDTLSRKLLLRNEGVASTKQRLEWQCDPQRLVNGKWVQNPQPPITGWVDAEWVALSQPYRNFVITNPAKWA